MPNQLIQTHQSLEHETHVLLTCEPRLPVLIVCDHASNRVPPELNNLGLTQDILDQHVGWDIGAAEVAVQLGTKLGVPVVLASTSRLVVDCNRKLDDPTAFPETSDGFLVPGNQQLDMQAREQRANTWYWPYHHAIRDQLRALEHLAAAPAVLAVHSFTPEMNGHQRPWHVGALWDKDSRIAKPFMAALSADPTIVIGDNEPYSGRHPADFTLDHHAELEGLPHLGIELRQDLIASSEGAASWAEVLAAALGKVFSDKQLFSLRAGIV
jgi:predicted N-formylglutamate amidohydrolase